MLAPEDHPTLEHGFIMNELADLADQVAATSEDGTKAMLFALTERFGVDLGLAVKAGKLTQEETAKFLQNTVTIASVICGAVVNDTYGMPTTTGRLH